MAYILLYYIYNQLHDLYKWHNRERINRKIKNIIEDQKPSFYNSLEESRIFVSDHLGTTFLEAMQANVPCIIFINQTSYLFRESFRPYIDKFIQQKILFYDPEEAALHLNSIYNEICKWWQSKSVQQLRDDFVEHHAYTSCNWMDFWIKEFC